MMIPVKTRYVAILGVFSTIGTALALIFNRLFFFNQNIFDFISMAISFFIIPLLLYFEQIGWRQRFFRIGGWLCKTPDLRGRWEGTIDRGDEVGPHKFCIEIRQTLSDINITSYSSRGKSESISAEILSDSDQTHYTLIDSWLSLQRGPLPQVEDVEPGFFHGTSVLEFKSGTDKRLEGFYYTNRPSKQTKGKIALEWKGYKLLHEKCR